MAIRELLARRRFLSQSLAGVGLMTIGGNVLAGVNEASRNLLSAGDQRQRALFLNALLGGLLPPDANGMRLPSGFSARIVARSGVAAASTSSYLWHGAPDGGATFASSDGGWIYACNAERGAPNGGVGVLKFDVLGNVVDSYAILSGTNRNCAGGPTLCNTWLSCEEFDQGLVWECNPYLAGQGVSLPALGTFAHEAAAVDPIGQMVYLTEDKGDSCFYRFRPAAYPSLNSGVLEVASINGDPTMGAASVTWTAVPNPNPTAVQTPTRNQVPGAARFDRGEGMYFHNGLVYFATTGDSRVWVYRVSDSTISVFYDAAVPVGGALREPDNVVVDGVGNVYVAEDSDDLQIVMLSPTGEPLPFVQLIGQDSSEIAGPAFSPDGSRFYFSSQRGTTDQSSGGITFEVTGPFTAFDRVYGNGFESV